MTEFCIWCESDEARQIEEAYGDPDFDKQADSTNWTKYRCGYCGCEFILGMKFISFQKLVKTGDPELHIDGPEAAEIQAVLGAVIAKDKED